MKSEDNNFTQDSQSDSDDDFTHGSLSDRATRHTYLITNSQIDKSKFPTSERFANAIVNTCNEGEGKVYVEHWACCLEPHKKAGEHFHLFVKLSGARQWKPIKEAVSDKHGVILVFSGTHDISYTAFKYVIKIDKEVLMSPRHPNLEEIGSTKTKMCVKAFREKSKKRKAENKFNPNDKNNKKGTKKRRAK